MDQAGNLYGTTQGGQNGGTIFRLTPVGNRWKFKTLYSSCSQSNCAGLSTPLIIDTAGNLYGTTRQSSGNDGGLIFELKPNATGQKWKYKQLYAFPCSDTGCPNGQLPSGLTYLNAASGQPYDGTSALFGTAAAGGTGSVAPLGVAFKLEPQNNRWKQTVLYSFCSVAACADGATPNEPVLDSAGRLWGTTSSGGDDRGGGVLYSLSGRTESVEYEFCSVTEDCLDGAFPASPVLLDKSGRIVGTTPFGGTFGAIPNGPGTLFAVSGGNEQVLYNFCSEAHCADGLHPSAGVIEDPAGNVFGVTAEGGDANDGGVAFEYRNGTLQVLHTFGSGADGCDPLGGLIMDAAGNLYGTTSACGAGSAGDGGTVFELSPK
jgi:uncharacterized repeat protein (TIGR03803 family)